MGALPVCPPARLPQLHAVAWLQAIEQHRKNTQPTPCSCRALCPCPCPLSFLPCRAFRPDIIHCSSPGIMWFAALIYSRLLRAPLVYSYHTHVPEYMPRWGGRASVCMVLPAGCQRALLGCRCTGARLAL